MRAVAGVFGSLPSSSRSLTMFLSDLPSSSPPIEAKVTRTAPPTLATGRRSKFIPLEGEAAIKRETRRRRNREAARKLKVKRARMEYELEKQIAQLESDERNLLTEVHLLQNYKFHLERQRHIISVHDRLIRQAALVSAQHARPRSPTPVSKKIKREPRPPSPQWLALFHI